MSFYQLRRQMDDVMNQMMAMNDPYYVHDPFLQQPTHLLAPDPQLQQLQNQQQQQLQQLQGGTRDSTQPSSSSSIALTAPGVGGQLIPAGQNWFPAAVHCDVHEENDKFIVNAELPGVAKDDIKVTMENGYLTISGDKREAATQKETLPSGNTVVRRSERRFGSFSRSFRLPTHADSDKVGASFNNGVLTLNIPKLQEHEHSARKLIAIN